MADRRCRRPGALVGLVLAGVVLAGCSTGAEESGALTSGIVVGNDDGMHGAVLTDQYVVPDVTLTATDGSDFSVTEDTTKPLTLVFFGYTRCPDICQVVMSSIASAMTRLDDAQRDQVDMLFITSDPARDDEETLRAYLDRFDPSFEGLTGDLDKVIRLGSALGVPIEKGTKLPSGGYEVAHGTQVIAIDGEDRSPIVWTQGTGAAEFAEDIAVLLSQD